MTSLRILIVDDHAVVRRGVRSLLESQPPLAALPTFGGLTKYLKILRISLMERLVYRADFFVTTLFRFLPLLSTLSEKQLEGF